jgi:SAM-dependent methyltransferase
VTALAHSFTDVFTSALRGENCHVVGLSEEPRVLPVGSWTRRADDGDIAVLERCVGPTLDIGCGPGRMTEHLAARGHTTLGVDVVPEAVFQTRERGGSALLRDVFSPLPGEGRWGTALLADGNIGIGGDPVALLRRAGELLEGAGRVVVDLAPPGTGLETRQVRLQAGTRRSRPFAWSVLGTDAIDAVAQSAGLRVAEVARHVDRWFAVLVKGG